ncbi:RNA pseudouridine synthase [Marivirga lumbricoides]|uniref:RNA pseudouridine synthase n=1 Tax=Marivirga lumbricoides TaxID=1046115 RepID=A0ABQ1N1C0_9BACT|nr:RNA pseudouridine synthase [Marivirga lumbricoides]
MSDSHFIHFKSSIEGVALQEKFTFPFSYQPHPLAELAADEVQQELKKSYSGKEISGKMYGVLIVQNEQNELGYLVAFSGQEETDAHAIPFVPPLFNRLEAEGFFRKGEEELLAMNKRAAELEIDPHFLELKKQLNEEKAKADTDLEHRQRLKHKAKMDRKRQRENAQATLTGDEINLLQKKLEQESIAHHYEYRDLLTDWRERIALIQEQVDQYSDEINQLKWQRKVKSADLQQQLFNQYHFLNKYGEKKNVTQIFEDYGTPPAGAGDCAAPKLLQYAFRNNFKPICMAEFWWGKTPKAELRKEGRFYPACSGKCKPILAHMLHGMDLDDDPLLNYKADDKEIEQLYEDEHLLVIHKPSGLLTAPSRLIKDSVYSRMQTKYPDADGPLVAHRLDKLTSGLMIIAKSKSVYVDIQDQFMARTISKRYVALLDGLVQGKNGEIHLPLAVDENNRPMQKVCYEKGRTAKTLWKVIESNAHKTLIQFTPITGRTHQLRVHAAHPDGLNTPIVGDKLYGKEADRLKLHAAYLRFVHPVTQKKMEFNLEPPFGL